MLLKHSCSTSRALPLLLKSRTPPLLLKRSNATNLHRWLGSASAPDHQGMCTLSGHTDHDYFLWNCFSDCLLEVKADILNVSNFSQHSGGYSSYVWIPCWNHELQNNLKAVMNLGTRIMSRFSNMSIFKQVNIEIRTWEYVKLCSTHAPPETWALLQLHVTWCSRHWGWHELENNFKARKDSCSLGLMHQKHEVAWCSCHWGRQPRTIGAQHISAAGHLLTQAFNPW